MAGRGTISVNQAPQYGDKTALDSASKAMTTTPMTGVQTPAPGAGRPATGQQPQQSQAAPQRGKFAGVPPDQQDMLNQVAQAWRTHQYWQNVVQQYPSEWSKMYAKDAQRVFEQARLRARSATPFFR